MIPTRRSIIIGSYGQDGGLLYQLLCRDPHAVIGIGRGGIETNIDGLPFATVDICNEEEVASLIQFFQPDEIYHLAAFHHSAEDKTGTAGEMWQQSYQVNTLSLLHCLEAMRLYSPHTRLFYAASSHIFGKAVNEVQEETTPINPVTVYGITKAMGLFIARHYREKFRLFTAVGILYNHESEYRSEKYVSAKIIHSAIRISKSEQQILSLGDLQAVVDWGYAPDYVQAMRLILAHPDPDDYIIATGERHTVQEFVEIVFQELGLDWRNHVVEKRDILMREMPVYIGNSDKLRRAVGWKPSVTFSEMVHTLVEASRER